MIIPYRGSLISARRGSLMRVCPEGSISLVGLMEQPVTIDSSGPSGAIGIEFKPSSAYRFFPFSLKEVRNSVALSDEMLGRQAAEMQRRLVDMPTVEGKLASIQGSLLSMLHDNERSDPLVEWAVGEIRKSHGMVSIIDLCQQVGVLEALPRPALWRSRRSESQDARWHHAVPAGISQLLPA